MSYLLLRHGYLFLFLYVLAVGIGLPIPADPLFLLMGAMVGNHRYAFLTSLAVSTAPALLGDLLWYQIGRFKGRSVLGLLCKLSLEPDTCVRKTEAAFSKRGASALLFAKFLPGMSLVSVTLAGISKMSFGRFLLADAAGCLLWTGSYLLLGRVFYRQVDLIIRWLNLFGQRAGITLLCLLTGYLAFKYFQRWLFLRNLRIARITPEQLAALLESGRQVTIVDLRDPAEVERMGTKIASALVLRPDEIKSRSNEIPDAHEVILYCT